MYRLVISSPIGALTLHSDGAALTALRFGADGSDAGACPLLHRAAGELAAYFRGELRTFSVPLSPAGTDFQRSVWDALATIPYGQTASYRDVARTIGNPRACRAVGTANHRNPLPILIPCHRVVGSDGSLTGYAGGLQRKQFLLALEKQHR